MCGPIREYKDLSDRELLNMVISEDTADYLMQNHTNLEDILLKSYPQELKQVKGIGDKRCSRLLAVAEIAYRLFDEKVKRKKRITKPEHVFTVSKDMQHLSTETVRAIYLDVKNQVIKIETLAVGSTKACSIDPKAVFAGALKRLAAGIILIHCHPSGDTTPSKEDIEITNRLKTVGDIIGIDFLDHVIIGAGSYQSIREYKLMRGDEN